MSFAEHNVSQESDVEIETASVVLNGSLGIPEKADSLVLFVHGSGSSRHSPRNRAVASYLRQRGIATLLMDLLTPQEEKIDIQTRHLRFDIDLLTGRVVETLDWVLRQEAIGSLMIGLFGASTGAAAALRAAVQRPDAVPAVVSRGGRPDLAGDDLAQVRADTLLIVGGNDFEVLALNEQSLQRMQCHRELKIIENASHLFEETGALEQVAKIAADWFLKHLQPQTLP